MSESPDLQVARTALRQYRIRPTGVSPCDAGRFRVDAARGPFLLRVGPSRSPLHARTEVAWLQRLVDDPAVSAPIPILNREGRAVTTVAPGHDCVLFEWAPGHALGAVATAFDWGLLGEASAHLHEAAGRWRRRSGLRPMVWDRVCWLPGEPSVLFDTDHRQLLPKRRRRVVDRLNRRVGVELRRLHRRPTHLLHGDLNPGHARLDHGEVFIAGFERVLLGAPVQDIAITLRYARERRGYRTVLAAFVDGYRSVREWPVEYAGQVNLLMAGLDMADLNRDLLRGTATDASVRRIVDGIARVLPS